MKKLDLNKAAEEFDMISSEMHLFYNIVTGEFAFYSDFMDIDDVDAEKFEGDAWIAAPRQRELNEYSIMVNFAKTTANPCTNELLCVALEGRGAFRRFKDTLHRVGLVDKWYTFKHSAFVEIAKEWCEENGIEYVENTRTKELKTTQTSKCTGSTDFTIIPFVRTIADDAAEVMCDALSYSKTDAAVEVKRLLSSKRIALAAIADNRVVGIIGAIPQYGVTGWELHPLAVLKEYQWCGIGTALIEALEQVVTERGGIMLYLGSDDESGTTSLYGVDLYDDTFGKLKSIQNTGGHPFPFYEKMGYKIVGVFPDANKPDIWMAKRIKRKM